MIEIWRITNDGVGWYHSGVDYGNREPITLVKVIFSIDGKHIPSHVVFKIPGGSHWKSRTSGYVSHGGEYRVLQVQEYDATTIKGTGIISIPLRTSETKIWKEIIK